MVTATSWQVRGIHWKMLQPRVNIEWLGYIPGYFSTHWLEEGFTAQQLVRHGYRQTAGCEPSEYWNTGGGKGQWTMLDGGVIKSKQSRKPLRPIAEADYGNEKLRFYEMSMFTITQPDGSFVIYRLD